MNLLLLSTLILSASNPSAIHGRDFYNTGNDLLTSTYTTMGPPTAYAYHATYDEPYYSSFDNVNIIKIPYQFSIDFSRIEHLQMQIGTQIFYMARLASPNYEYHYFSIYAPVEPGGYYKQPFQYFANSGVDRYYLRIPTTHDTSMATQYFENIVFMNSLAYAEEFDYSFYQDGFTDGYQDGAFDGYQDGFAEGIISGGTPQEWQGLFGILRSGFNSLSAIMQIQVLPGFTVGLLLFLPLIFGVAYAILKLFMRGG